jgi:hypothetical protein
MPTNRTKRTRDRAGAAGLTESALSYFWWNGTIYSEWRNGKSETEVLKFWQKNRKEILEWFIEKNRQRKGDPGKRPEYFWDEITEPRRKTGTEKYWPSWGPDGPPKKEEIEIIYETDYQFLKRLNLLQGWELDYKPPEKAKKGGKTK